MATSIIGGCTSSRVYPQPPPTNFSSSMTAPSTPHRDGSMDPLCAACGIFGLINTEKTLVMHQPPPNAAHNTPQISVDGTHPQVVDNFTYLNITLSRSNKIDDFRIFEASQAFDRLQNRLKSLRSLTLH
nr:unnamed protein product [Spirometra erinaceieuropaei]